MSSGRAFRAESVAIAAAVGPGIVARSAKQASIELDGKKVGGQVG